jgi:hypothetical protein
MFRMPTIIQQVLVDLGHRIDHDFQAVTDGIADQRVV